MSLELNTTIALQNLSQGGFDAAAKQAAAERQPSKLDIAAQEFEAMFISEMMKPMFEGIKVDPMFGGGKGEEVFTSMLIQEYGKIMAETGQIGIADAVKAQLLQVQESALSGAAMNEEKTSDDTPAS